MKNHLKTLLVLSLVSFAAACEDDHDDHDHDQELITKVVLTLTPQGGGTAVTATWSDADGAGGNAPVISGMQLVKGVTYNGTVSVLDESKSPVFDVTEEVLEEAEEHQFFYTFTPSGNVTVSILDQDANNRPLGVQFRFAVSASAPNSLTLNVKLSHFDNPADKNGTTPSDENDVNVDFPVTLIAGS
jgi:hypothetical protein